MLGAREAGLAGALHLGALTLTSITLKVKCHARLRPDCSSGSWEALATKQAGGSKGLCGSIWFYKTTKPQRYQCRFPSLGAAGKRNEGKSRLCPSLPAEEVRWVHMVLHGVRQPWTTPLPTAASQCCIPPPQPQPDAQPSRETEGSRAGRAVPYFVSSSLSFSVSCLSSSFSPSFSFSFSFSSFSSWLLRGICCCCCKTRDIKQTKP